MDTLTAITTRRSIRNYLDEELDVTLIQELLRYALYAPSAHNEQAWKYYIISKKEDRIFLSEVMEFWKMLPSAWWAVLACFDKDKVRSIEFVQQDMWASIQNFLLAAHEKWVGSVWLGLYPHEVEMKKISEYFKLPENVVPFAIISLGRKSWEVPEKLLKDEWKIEVL